MMFRGDNKFKRVLTTDNVKEMSKMKILQTTDRVNGWTRLFMM